MEHLTVHSECRGCLISWFITITKATCLYLHWWCLLAAKLISEVVQRTIRLLGSGMLHTVIWWHLTNVSEKSAASNLSWQKNLHERLPKNIGNEQHYRSTTSLNTGNELCDCSTTSLKIGNELCDCSTTSLKIGNELHDHSTTSLRYEATWLQYHIPGHW